MAASNNRSVSDLFWNCSFQMVPCVSNLKKRDMCIYKYNFRHVITHRTKFNIRNNAQMTVNDDEIFLKILKSRKQ